MPLIFEPYAADLAERVAAVQPQEVLEVAAGTGVVTRALASRLHADVRIVATDLNPPMLDQAARRLSDARVEWRQADALALPFEDQRFDAVVCQFGAMFFPDRVGAYREALRVLRPGGRFLFNVWDRLDLNPASLAVSGAVASLFPDDPPGFLARTPFGYHDTGRIEADLRAAGFGDIGFETVARRSRTGAPREAAVGLCGGSPLRAEIEARDVSRLVEADEAAAAALESFAGPDGIDAPMSAHVFTAGR